ncbi:hypothetical protein CCS38_23160 [Streptomyces purpurogeneiscleroticus]|nr:hypothetical protein [Streptomyces purpurogeneiscleroticus]
MNHWTTARVEPLVGRDLPRDSSREGNEVTAVIGLPEDGRGTRGRSAPERGIEPRWLPAGDPRSLPRLDAEAAGRNAAGEDVQVVYSARGDRFMIVPRPKAAA